MVLEQHENIAPLKQQRSTRRLPRKDYSSLNQLGIVDFELKEERQIKPRKEQTSALVLEVAARAVKRRRRVLVDLNDQHSTGIDLQNEYERQRAERMQRNAKYIQDLGLKQLSAVFSKSIEAPAVRRGVSSHVRRQKAEPRPVPAIQIRQSGRQRGLAPSEDTSQLEGLHCTDDPDERGSECLLDLEEYFKRKGQDVPGYRVKGNFEGWVNPAVCERYGIAGNADEAWESNGGGKFTFRIDKKAIPANLKSRGWSDARAFSSTQLQKNPNAYFYRHVAPHEQQALGEWTEEEHQLFLATAKKYGIGDKWGLFSSYIPQRVGYQCSAYYREVVLAHGLIFDPQYKMTSNGKVVYGR